jgi:hypothetical protein
MQRRFHTARVKRDALTLANHCRSTPINRHSQDPSARLKGAKTEDPSARSIASLSMVEGPMARQ